MYFGVARPTDGSTPEETAALTVVVEPVDSKLRVLADLDDVAVGIAHVATPFPAVRVSHSKRR